MPEITSVQLFNPKPVEREINFNPVVYDAIGQSLPPQLLQHGGQSNVLFYGKMAFSSTTEGYRMGLDIDGRYKWTLGGTTSNIDFNITNSNALTIKGTTSAIILQGDGATFIARTTGTATPGFNVEDSGSVLRMSFGYSPSNDVGFIGYGGNAHLTVNSGGRIGIGVTSAATSALLELSSTTGALLVTRMTTTQKNALTAVNGLVVYDSTLNKFQGYENGAWTSFI